MLKKVHFVGIGGIGMSGIAEVLVTRGISVQGSDLSHNDNTARLEGLGAKIFYSHEAEQVSDADIVVISSDIKSDNPEVQQANQLGIPVIPRARMLAELMRLQQGIAVAGSHGKTTTTSLVAAILEHAALDPTVVIGGKVNHLGSNAKHGSGKFLVAEADESDGSFQMLLPNIAVVTNLDPEHLDYWKGGLPQLQQAFIQFLNTLPFFGLAVLCQDAATLQTILPEVKRRVVTYGLTEGSEYRATNLKHERFHTEFSLQRFGEDLGQVRLRLLGEHNVQNALAAIAVGDEIGISLDVMKEALESFAGVQRRFTQVGDKNGILVIDDYGHHPTEIKAVLSTAQKTFKDRRICVLFEPHRYTRTRDLMDDFVDAFHDADLLVLSDIYPAREKPIEGISSKILAEKIKALRNVTPAKAGVQTGFRKGPEMTEVIYGGSLENSTQKMVESLKPGDVVITLGAGTVTKAAPKILELIESV